MKYLFPLFTGCALAALTTASADVYTGNGATGFGGAVGEGMLAITSSGNTINFAFTPGGTSGFNDDAVIYIDSTTGGITDTSTLSDNGDGGREAISGDSNANGTRTLVTFANGFAADFAISLEGTATGNYAGLFSLATPTGFAYIDGMAPTLANGTYSFNLTYADLGLAAGSSFNFVSTYVSTTAYRSNESIGTSVTTLDPANLGTAPNAGTTGSQTFSDFETFGAAAVPEPGPLAYVGFGTAAVAGLALRRSRRTAGV